MFANSALVVFGALRVKKFIPREYNWRDANTDCIQSYLRKNVKKEIESILIHRNVHGQTIHKNGKVYHFNEILDRNLDTVFDIFMNIDSKNIKSLDCCQL